MDDMEIKGSVASEEGQEVQNKEEEVGVGACAEIASFRFPGALREMVKRRDIEIAKNNNIPPAERVDRLREFYAAYSQAHAFEPGDLVIPKWFYRSPDDPQAERSIRIVVDPLSVPGDGDEPRETLRLASLTGSGFHQENFDPLLFEPYVASAE